VDISGYHSAKNHTHLSDTNSISWFQPERDSPPDNFEVPIRALTRVGIKSQGAPMVLEVSTSCTGDSRMANVAFSSGNA
jgi:hypothetical protein